MIGDVYLPEIPEAFARRIIANHGIAGRRWLDRLPAILAVAAMRWQLTLGPPITPLAHHFVVTARRADGSAVILKVHAPRGESPQEAAALRSFDGRGMVRLLDSDPDDAVLLMERGEPGTPLRAIAIGDDERATAIACDLMRQLWRPPPAAHSFPGMADWNADLQRLRPHFGGGTGPFPVRIIEEVEALVMDLTASMATPVLLHGDLHHDNIIAAARQPWLAINPKGLIGEPAYETGPLFFNPQPELLAAPNPARILARRVDQLAEMLGYERARIRGWGLVRAVLATWWHVESSGNVWAEALTCAEILSAMRA